jgi:hypothetical protein
MRKFKHFINNDENKYPLKSAKIQCTELFKTKL